MFLRIAAILATAALAIANPLNARQATNTNGQVAEVLDELSIAVHHSIVDVVTMQSNQTANDGTIGRQVQEMITVYSTAASDLQAIPISSGSTTVQPTNVELSRVFGEALQLVATGFSGLQDQGTVPNFNAMISQLDPAVAGATMAFNTTIPGGIDFIRILMLDAQQFLVAQGSWPETLVALGF